jgi:hypothetical protein
MAFKFRTVKNTEQHLTPCPRCGGQQVEVQYSDHTSKVACSVSEHHDGDLCARVGHPEAWNTTEECPLCAAPARWYRVEVREGKAYTYVSYEEPPLESGEWVRVPGNVVQTEPFAGKVIRPLPDGPGDDYAGPYKALMGRLL